MPSKSSIQLPKVIGHRGASYYAPENTVASLMKASELKVSWVEFDVMLTRDEQAIVFHDDKLDCTTNGSGLIAHTDYEKIASLDAGAWFSAQFAGEKIPTFVDYLKKAQDLNLSINVEIKPTVGTEEKTATKVIEILQQYWLDRSSLLISSFSIKALEQVRALDQQVHLGLLLNDWVKGWQITSETLNCISINILHTLLTTEKVAMIKTHVPYVLAYTVNDKHRALELFAMGVDGVFSDKPDVVI